MKKLITAALALLLIAQPANATNDSITGPIAVISLVTFTGYIAISEYLNNQEQTPAMPATEDTNTIELTSKIPTEITEPSLQSPIIENKPQEDQKTAVELSRFWKNLDKVATKISNPDYTCWE